MSQSTPPADDVVESVVMNGKTFYTGPAPTPPPRDFAGTTFCTEPLPIANANANATTFDHHTLEAYSAFNGPIHASIDWLKYSQPINPKDNNPSPVAFWS